MSKVHVYRTRMSEGGSLLERQNRREIVRAAWGLGLGSFVPRLTAGFVLAATNTPQPPHQIGPRTMSGTAALSSGSTTRSESHANSLIVLFARVSCVQN